MADLTRAEERALAAIDRNAVVASLVDLLAVPSISGTDAESDVQHLLAKDVHALGLDVDLWSMDVAALSAADGFPGSEAPRSEAWGLVGTQTGESAVPALVLQGHVDVVPPGDLAHWRTAPFEPTLVGGRIHGRGACDMKAGVVANLAAVRAIRDSGVRLRGGLALHLVIGEEDGGLGAFGTLRRGHTGDACVITEPTSGTLITGAAGALTFTLEVPGAATHAATPYAGSSAIDSYVRLHMGLQSLQAERNRIVEPLMREYPTPYPLVIGRVQAGDWSSSVPDRLVAEGRLGLRIEEDPAVARAELEHWVGVVAQADPYLRDHPPVVTWSGGQFAGGSLPDGHPLAGVVAAAHADVTGGPAPRERGAPYGSDLRLYADAGIPTLHYGPGDVRLAHGPEEAVEVDEVVRVVEALVLTALRTCGTHDG
ncbi:ArgE/DapE family deacylase [Blastococcus haudaquaticus]|uniref:Acetylornithine deacetylase n=1 Tax=Blastococcus haudaquaticus TaxID=1938745 RepID=A0A286GFS2_9ACTN|nr:ArgE/DapE family deacylase [Blastococcus haudaquaticus]SOD93864.1 acetylornithine deacetylase [Blastococcus haudaquaticus]